MPKIYRNDAERQRAKAARQAQGYSMAVATCRARTGRTDQETARLAGVSRDTFWALKKPENVQSVKFGSVRAVANAIGLTREEWLKLGGYSE